MNSKAGVMYRITLRIIKKLTMAKKKKKTLDGPNSRKKPNPLISINPYI